MSIPWSLKHQETETERSEIQGRDMGGELSQPGGAPDGKPHSTSRELCQSPGQLAPHQEVLYRPRQIALGSGTGFLIPHYSILPRDRQC